MYNVEQYVMAYRADHDEIKALLPEGYESLRPVLRINVEVITDPEGYDPEYIYIEFNTPVAAAGKRGWLNLTAWDNEWTDIVGIKGEEFTRFIADFDGTEFLDIEFRGTGREGGCPKENDNDGIFFIEADSGDTTFAEAEEILEHKEYCDCKFTWQMPDSDDFTDKPELIRQAAGIKCDEVLGAYRVNFIR